MVTSGAISLIYVDVNRGAAKTEPISMLRNKHLFGMYLMVSGRRRIRFAGRYTIS